MKPFPIRNNFIRMTDDRYSDIECAVCGYGIRRGEDIRRNENGQICHAECVEEVKSES